MKRFCKIRCKYHDLGVIMVDFLGRFAFRHLSIGDQQFALDNKSILRKNRGIWSKHNITLSSENRKKLSGSGARRRPWRGTSSSTPTTKGYFLTVWE